MATAEPKEIEKSTAGNGSKKLYCSGRACLTCGKCCDWRFTGDAASWDWIRNYTNWGNNDWKRWRRDHMWKFYERNDGATCASVSHGPGNTYDDPIFGGHRVFHTINICGSYNIQATHDSVFVGDQIADVNRIVSSVGDLCVCNTNQK